MDSINTLIDPEGTIVPKVLATFPNMNFKSPNEALAQMRSIIDHDRGMMANPHHLQSVHWPTQFQTLGGLAIVMHPSAKPFDPVVFQKLLTEKSKMYGDKPIRAWGPIGVVIRIDSKLLRYENMIASKNQDTEDTLTDIVGYCVLGYRLVTQS